MARPVAITSHLAPVPPGFKPHWRDILEENVAIYRRLPEDLTLAVEELIPWFIEKVEWEWSHWVGPKPDKELQQVPILMVTLHHSRDNVMAAMRAGFFSYIVKPLNPQVLEKKLR